MSKLVKGVKKVFKKVGQAIKKFAKSKIGKVIIAAAAIYFTGGLAAGSFAPSAVFGQIASTAGSMATGVGEALGFAAPAAEATTSTGLLLADASEAAAAGVGATEAAGGAELLAGGGDLLGENAVNFAGGTSETLGGAGGGTPANLTDNIAAMLEENAAAPTPTNLAEAAPQLSLDPSSLPQVQSGATNAMSQMPALPEAQRGWISEALNKVGIDIKTPEGKFIAGQMLMGAGKGAAGYFASQAEADAAAAMYAERLRNRGVGDYTSWFRQPQPANIAQAQATTPESAKVYLGERESEAGAQPRSGSSQVARTYIAGKTLPAQRRA